MAKKNSRITTEKKNGRFYTPIYIVNNILDLSGYVNGDIRKKHVIDNSCGDGAFLTEIVRRYCDDCDRSGVTKDVTKSELECFVHGVELDSEEAQKCRNNVSAIAAEYGINHVNWDITCENTLQVKRFDGKMDFVLGNPPYIRVHNLGDTFDEIKTFSFAQNGMTDLFIVFYEVGLRMLNKTGVLGYITPSSFFNSLAGNYMRKQFVDHHYLEKVVDLKHFQAFEATTYTTIVILRNNKDISDVDYYTFDELSLSPKYCATLTPEDFYIVQNFYFGTKGQLELLKKIFFNFGHSDILVKNGYATLCDDVFINDFDFESPLIRPVIKASKGIKRQMLYPYDENAVLISEPELEKDTKAYKYLKSCKEKLTKRNNERDADRYWYAFGRSQALLDTYKDKVAINTLLRTKSDIKLTPAPAGTGVYSGLYMVSDTTSTKDMKAVLETDEFVLYIALLSKYKSGGYYTFSSKDLKVYLDYKFAYDGGACE